MDIADQCSHIVVPCSAATASQRTHGRLDGMARPAHTALVKFIAGWVDLAKRKVAKEEVECRSLGASGATFKGLRTSPELLREFHSEFCCEFSCEFFVLKDRSQMALKNSPDPRRVTKSGLLVSFLGKFRKRPLRKHTGNGLA